MYIKKQCSRCYGTLCLFDKAVIRYECVFGNCVVKARPLDISVWIHTITVQVVDYNMRPFTCSIPQQNIQILLPWIFYHLVYVRKKVIGQKVIREPMTVD